MKYRLKIEPSVPCEVRHKVEDCLIDEGYRVTSGGQTINAKKSESFTDISFEEQ